MGFGLRTYCRRCDRRYCVDRTESDRDVDEHQQQDPLIAAVDRETFQPDVPARAAGAGRNIRAHRMVGCSTGGRRKFMSLFNGLRSFVSSEEGTETLEWGLVCGLLVVGAIAAIALIGPKVTAMWTNVNSKIP